MFIKVPTIEVTMLLVVAALLGCAPQIQTSTSPATEEISTPADEAPSQPAAGVTRSWVVDATSEEAWVYVDLDGAIATASSSSWDLAFRRFVVEVNGGVSGSGGRQVVPIAGDTLEVSLPDEGWITDIADADGDGEPERAFDEWYDYDETTHVLSPKARVYLVRSEEGGTHAVRFDAYYDEVGTAAKITLTVHHFDGVTAPDVADLPEAVDADLDGSPVPQDCNDHDPRFHPDAVDYAHDQIDQNCDGVDGLDADGDGFAVDWSGGLDCDDTDPWISPSALDVTADGIDQDCDGADGQGTEADPSPTETLVHIDATDAGGWIGFSFVDGEVSADPLSSAWDLSFRRFDIRLNGGVSGPGTVEAVVLDQPWSDVTTAPTAGWLQDQADADADGVDELVMLDWYLYDLTQHRLTAADRVYVVRTPDGDFKLQMLDYYDAFGVSGHPSFRWAPIP